MLVLLVLACGDDDRVGQVDVGLDTAPRPDTSSDSGQDSGGGVDASRDTTPPPRPAVWAHSGRELFRYDPVSDFFENRGVIHIAGEMIADDTFFSLTDIAVNEAGELYGISSRGVWLINPENASATLVNANASGMALSFVSIDGVEVLVAGNERELNRVSLQGGQVSPLATISGDCVTSGDIATIFGLGTFVTVRCNNDRSLDYLARLDVTRGSVELVGPTGVGKLWGLGFWAGVFYGFSGDGELVQINANTGAGTVLRTVSEAQGGFWGAGVIPSAPLM